MGDHAETFKPLAGVQPGYFMSGLQSLSSFIEQGDQIISKTYMTKVENENTRLRHYLARLHR